ncbi:hypothetical protein ACFP1Z_11025 [Streptomyces gamaensis]|uniref:Secreted protein n=1 Tax=Streptomyces gamaensis TaxID=1763542 RepID=A0ABW0YVY4_9ACTN
MRRQFGTVLATAGVLAATAAGPAQAAPSGSLPGGVPGAADGRPPATAEIFATNSTATITDPADPRLRTRLTRFDREVRGVIRANGAHAGRSTLLDGVYWSTEHRTTTYERSREFDVGAVSPAGLRHIAAVLAKRYHQESVLTFRRLPRSSPQANAVDIEAPGVTARGLRAALAADPAARRRLGGGSVTVDSGRLVLIAPRKDLALARKFTARLGVRWKNVTLRYGAEEFVGAG